MALSNYIIWTILLTTALVTGLQTLQSQSKSDLHAQMKRDLDNAATDLDLFLRNQETCGEAMTDLDLTFDSSNLSNVRFTGISFKYPNSPDVFLAAGSALSMSATITDVTLEDLKKTADSTTPSYTPTEFYYRAKITLSAEAHMKARKSIYVWLFTTPVSGTTERIISCHTGLSCRFLSATANYDGTNANFNCSYNTFGEVISQCSNFYQYWQGPPETPLANRTPAFSWPNVCNTGAISVGGGPTLNTWETWTSANCGAWCLGPNGINTPIFYQEKYPDSLGHRETIANLAGVYAQTMGLCCASANSWGDK